MPSPDFAINGGTVNEPQSVAASAAVTALLDDISGVRQVSWEISRTDDLSVPADYALVVSGSVGQQCATTALLAGTAAVLKATINGGLDAATDQPSDATIREVKFWVPDANGIQVLCAGELDSSGLTPDRVSSLTHGAVAPLNDAIRAMGYRDSGAVKTANYDAVYDDMVDVDASGGDFAVTLPTAVGYKNRGITVFQEGASGTVTFNTTASQTMSGVASGALTLATQYDYYTFISNGANWRVFPKP